MRSRGRRGVTLIEVLIAVSLLSLLSVGMLMAMRVGLNALNRANSRLIDNRRVIGVERILEQQIAGLVPVMAMCAVPQARVRMTFFQGEPQAMRFVSTFSLTEAWRGRPQLLEYLVIPRDDGEGVRLVVNEVPYTGAEGAGNLCLGPVPGPTGDLVPRFLPIQAGPRSFVLADRLAACKFSYLAPAPVGTPPPALPVWRPDWPIMDWPLAVRIDMRSIDEDPSRLRPLTVTAPIEISRNPLRRYAD